MPNRKSPDVSFNHVFHRYKHDSKTKNRIFDLNKEQFREIVQRDCFYCGTKPSQTNFRRGLPYTYNGVDRFDNSIGYTIDNAVACCRVHNHMKSDMTHEDFIAACRSVVEFQDQKVSKAFTV